MSFLLLLLILPSLGIWAIHVSVENPSGAALGTWLMLTILGTATAAWAKAVPGYENTREVKDEFQLAEFPMLRSLKEILR